MNLTRILKRSSRRLVEAVAEEKARTGRFTPPSPKAGAMSATLAQVSLQLVALNLTLGGRRVSFMKASGMTPEPEELFEQKVHDLIHGEDGLIAVVSGAMELFAEESSFRDTYLRNLDFFCMRSLLKGIGHAVTDLRQEIASGECGLESADELQWVIAEVMPLVKDVHMFLNERENLSSRTA